MSEIKEKTSFEENRTTSVGSNEVALDHSYDEVEVKRVVRKIDRNLLPLVTLLYLLSFLDRANIGNARVAGMAVDVKLTGLKYNVVAAVFFIPYALAEVPSNILLKLIRPSRWIPSIMVAWGLVMTLMCLCNTYESLIIARCFLGLAEAGLFPGVTFYLSMWYRRRDVAFRIAIFFSAATLAGAFGGLLAYAIDKMDGIGGLHGWQWIFCLEGMLTVLVAVGAYFWMHDYPATASFLTEHEKTLIQDVLKADTNGQATGYSKTYVWQAFKDYKTYIAVVLYMGILIPVYAISLFLPTIVNQLGYAPATSQLLTIPPFVLGCIMTVTFGYLSDKYQRRGPFVIAGCLLAMVGYLVLYNTSKPGPGYAGTVLAAMGVFPTVAVDLAWAGSMAGGDVRKGVVLAMVIGLGNLGGVCSSFIYITPPRFHIGHGTIMGWLGLTIILSVFSMWDYNRRNKAKIAQCEREGIDPSQWAKYKDMGSESPLFRYTL